MRDHREANRGAGRHDEVLGADQGRRSPDDGDGKDEGPRDLYLEDAVVQLVGKRALGELLRGELGPEADARHARFYSWWARELRMAQVPEEAAETDRLAAAWAERMIARLAAERGRLRLAGAAPAIRGVSEVPAAPYEAGDAAEREPGSLRGCVDASLRSRWAPLVDLAAAAGVGRELWDEPCAELIAIPDDLPRARYLALRVAGDSMTPLLHAGDRVLVKVGARPVRDAVVVARRPDDGYVIKRVSHLAPDAIELASLNPDYPPFWLRRDQRLLVGTVVMRWCAHEAAVMR